MVRMGVGRDIPKGHRVVGGPFNLARAEHAAGVAVDQQAQQHCRVVRIRASTSVLPDQLTQIKLVNDFNDKARQVIARQPLINRGRQQVGGLSVNGNEATHRLAFLGSAYAIVTPRPSSRNPGKPDRLLANI